MMERNPGLGTCQFQWYKNSQLQAGLREGAFKSPGVTLPAKHKELTDKSSYSGDCLLRKLGLSFRYLFLCNGLWTPPYSPNVKRRARSSIFHPRVSMLSPSFIYPSERVRNGRTQGTRGCKELALELQ